MVRAILVATTAAFRLDQLVGNVEAVTITPRWRTIDAEAVLRRAGA